MIDLIKYAFGLVGKLLIFLLAEFLDVFLLVLWLFVVLSSSVVLGSWCLNLIF